MKTIKGITIRFTKEEWDRIEAMCEELGITKASYFRLLVRRTRIEVLRR